MYCPYMSGECYSNAGCLGCSLYQNYWQGVNKIHQQYNYKCPCGGEFMYPVCTIGTSAYNYKCPFCGKPMEGMNG